MDPIVIVLVVIVLFVFFGGSKSSGNRKSASWANSNGARTFTVNLVGVTYENRQNVIRTLKPGDIIEPRFFEWEGRPALNFIYNNRSIGVLPKEYAYEFKKNESKITKVMVKSVYGGGQYNYGVTVIIYFSE